MLLSLKRVLLCSVRVGVPRVSWAVRYLDKIQWRAVMSVVHRVMSNTEARNKFEKYWHIFGKKHLHGKCNTIEI